MDAVGAAISRPPNHFIEMIGISEGNNTIIALRRRNSSNYAGVLQSAANLLIL